MEHTIATVICRMFIKQGIIAREYEDVYIYGLELVFSFIFSTLVILLTSILLHELSTAIVFLCIFISLRRFTGGYHATTYFRCKLCTISIFAFVTILSDALNVSLIAYILLNIIGLYIILRYGPIENAHKPLSDEVKRKNKYISAIIFLVLSIVGSVVYLCYQKLSNAIFYTLGFVIVLMIIPMLKKGEEHEKNRKTCS